ncbi:MAG: ATP synthase F1 subunit gamma [Candidatus Eremiobacteraeota bacterium]|nr:ATP synthase F1 subunit gamma [Candidatus Eremiobacteraeota bacterium]
MKSLKNTQQITRAMKMVAGARIRRAELAMRAARPYSAAIGEMLAEVSRTAGGLDHPLLRERAPKTPAVLLMTADKGLAGAFNANLARAAQAVAAQGGPQTVLYCVGTKGATMLRRSAYRAAATWPLGVGPFASAAREISARISEDFAAGTVDSVTLVSSRFVSTIVQRPTTQRLLPLTAVARDGADREPEKARSPFEFEPDARAVLTSLLPKYLEFTIFAALLETQASEFAARLLAMSNATDNAGKLIDELTLVMNNTRQASITKEILEIVGGAEAQRA